MSFAKTLKEAFEGMRKIVDLAEKPDADDFKQILRITLLGFTIIGVAAFALSWLINFVLQVSGAGIT
ncbi:MAG: hypothetical protein N3D82_04765 [Ignisphaera sp.]|nr:hypothetical protein [Ignisphaera sp.]MCX8168321.1 hypothetical protein [Ignisphaera sp.]MDW8085347.1 hypothetical protein [Ignisphaera sp.]